MKAIILVFLGGGLGSVLRFTFSKALNSLQLPWGTILANLTGTFLIGLFSVLILDKQVLNPNLKEFMLIGFLGGLTTFSSFTNEAYTLFSQERYPYLFLYLFANLILGVTLLIIAKKIA